MFNHNKLSKNKFFMNIYKKLKKIYESRENNITYDKLIIEHSVLDNNILNNNFTSSEIKDDIIRTIKYAYKIIYKNNILYYYSSKKRLVQSFILQFFKIINSLRILFKTNNKDNIQVIKYFDTNNKKTFPKTENGILSPNEINSGLTILSHDHNGEIILYRKEEVFKVLIHELIHSNAIDHKLIFSSNVKDFSSHFCVNYIVLFNEAYTEACANILNLFFINIIDHCNNKSNNKKMLYKDLDKMFNEELNYSKYIYSKIMNYYGLNNINDIIKKDNKCSVYFPQKTNVFSYYFLKFILLLHLDEMAVILKKQNNLLKITDEIYIDLLIKLVMDNLKDINNYFIKNCKDKNKSLRLTCHEIKV
jgi:hypothetical protein